MDEAELGRRIGVYLRLELPDAPTVDRDGLGQRLAGRLWPLIATCMSHKRELDLLWSELDADYPEVATAISFEWSGSERR